MKPLETTRLGVGRYAGDDRTEVSDLVAVEEPLEIRAAGEPLAVTMRTPGKDEWLTAGFLMSEGIITSLKDVSRIYHCGRPGTEESHSTIDVTPAPGTTFDLESVATSKRGTLITSACGVCGRRSIEDLVSRCRPLTSTAPVTTDAIRKSVSTLRENQPVFEQTGGVHAASLCDHSGIRLVCNEDIGRHNAVDKSVGALLYGEADRDRVRIMAISGRASFEMVQKAAMARIPVVASVSAASSLAISLADALGITLAGFVRGKSMNVYTHGERIS